MTDLMLVCAILICDAEAGHSAFIEDQQNNNASLTLMSQDGIHMTTRLQYADGTVEWIGFRSKYSLPIGPGEIDVRDHSDKIRLYVMLPVDSERLKQARDAVVADFQNSTYRLNNNNCVFFASELAKTAGFDLKDAFDVGKTPEQVVRLYAEKFRDVAVFDVRPFPWEQTGLVAIPGQYRVRLDWIKCHKPETVFGKDKVYVRAYIDNHLVFESDGRKSLRRGDRADIDADVVTVSAGQAIVIQLWDDDKADRDDLIFDRTITVSQPDTLVLKQTKGEVLLGSQSTYEIQVTIVP